MKLGRYQFIFFMDGRLIDSHFQMFAFMFRPVDALKRVNLKMCHEDATSPAVNFGRKESEFAMYS